MRIVDWAYGNVETEDDGVFVTYHNVTIDTYLDAKGLLAKGEVDEAREKLNRGSTMVDKKPITGTK